MVQSAISYRSISATNGDIMFIMMMCEKKIGQCKDLLSEELFLLVALQKCLSNPHYQTFKKRNETIEKYLERDEQGNAVEDLSDKIRSLAPIVGEQKKYKFIDKESADKELEVLMQSKIKVDIPLINLSQWSKLNWENNAESYMMFNLIMT